MAKVRTGSGLYFHKDEFFGGGVKGHNIDFLAPKDDIRIENLEILRKEVLYGAAFAALTQREMLKLLLERT
jgi:hypothetical protein